MIPLLLTLAALQADRLPPANPLPPPGSEEAGVMRPINALIAALGAGDAAVVTANTLPEGAVTSVEERPDSSRNRQRLGWAEFAGRMKLGGSGAVERIWSPAVEIDGPIAMAWMPYLVRVGGRIDHCGFNHFDLVRDVGGWRVLNITYSRRTTDCAAPAGL